MLDPIRAALQKTTATPQQQQNNFNMQAAKQTFNSLLNSKNPSMLIQNMMSQNPQVQQLMNLLQSTTAGNANIKTIYETLARQNGLDPDKFLRDLQS